MVKSSQTALPTSLGSVGELARSQRRRRVRPRPSPHVSNGDVLAPLFSVEVALTVASLWPLQQSSELFSCTFQLTRTYKMKDRRPSKKGVMDSLVETET